MNRRSILVLALATTSLFLWAACSPATVESPELAGLAEKAQAIAGDLAEVESLVRESRDELATVESRTEVLESGVQQFVSSAQIHALGRAVGIPDPPAGQVALRFSFTYLPELLPGDGILVYEPAPEVNTVWAMESLPKGEALPVGPALEANTLFFAPGEAKTVTVAYQNPTGEEVGFLVLPHQESPGNLAAYVWPTCLCMSFVYSAPPEGSWYRVIKITVSPDTPPGSKIDILWPVLTDPSVFPED